MDANDQKTLRELWGRNGTTAMVYHLSDILDAGQYDMADKDFQKEMRDSAWFLRQVTNAFTEQGPIAKSELYRAAEKLDAERLRKLYK